MAALETFLYTNIGRVALLFIIVVCGYCFCLLVTAIAKKIEQHGIHIKAGNSVLKIGKKTKRRDYNGDEN